MSEKVVLFNQIPIKDAYKNKIQERSVKRNNVYNNMQAIGQTSSNSDNC